MVAATSPDTDGDRYTGLYTPMDNAMDIFLLKETLYPLGTMLQHEYRIIVVAATLMVISRRCPSTHPIHHGDCPE